MTASSPSSDPTLPMQTKKMIIAIDGPAASGKGTLARKIAQIYDFAYLDTGKLYRLVGVSALEQHVDLDDEHALAQIAQALKTAITPAMLADPKLITGDAGVAASRTAHFPAVRAALLDLQRHFPHTTDKAGVVLDGRDIGSIIFPQADVKFFITADLQTRTRRRFDELTALAPNKPVDYDALYADMQARDARDSGRATAPTTMAPDAILIDTTTLSIPDAFAIIQKHMPKG